MSQPANLQSAHKALSKALEASRTPEGFDEDVFRARLGTHQARKLDALLSATDSPGDLQVLLSDPTQLDTLAQAIAPTASRQSLAEKSALQRLASDLSPFFFRNPVQPLPRQGKASFVVCPDISKTADAFGRVDDIGYVFVHKCSNFHGGSQSMVQAELERIAMASTFPATRYDGFVLRSPERVLSRCTHAFATRKTVLVLLQDGQGREQDLAELQAICAHANQHPSLFVFADTTENFVLMQPMIHAHLVGEDALSACQMDALVQAQGAFTAKFPQGHNGF